MVVKPAWILTYVEVGVFAFIRGDAQIRALKPLFGFPKRPQKPIVSSRGGGGGVCRRAWSMAMGWGRENLNLKESSGFEPHFTFVADGFANGSFKIF